MNSITGLIVKPNQIGSLIEVRKIMELCSKKCIKTIVSHRSGETGDSFIADLAFAMQADFIKIPVIGEERLSKVHRLMKIEAGVRK
jgi:enolase